METLDILKELIRKHVNPLPENLNADSRLEEIGIDSLALLEMMFEFEEKYGVRVPDESARPETVGQVIDLFDKLRAPVGNA